MKRIAFFVSDSTGITAEVLGNSLLAQFEGLEFDKRTLPYIDTLDKAKEVVLQINAVADETGEPPIVFDTVVDAGIRDAVAQSNGFVIDIFESFLKPLEKALQTDSSYTVGRSHGGTLDPEYQNRINAVHYALDSDDGGKLNQYEKADIILVGVSRSGKTPTCLYLAMQFGVYAANYPITEEDMEHNGLPRALTPYRDKLFGLTIEPERLASIRQERKANSRYASATQCEDEVRQAEAMFKRFGIRMINTTHFSIEEIATRIIASTGLSRRVPSP